MFEALPPDGETATRLRSCSVVDDIGLRVPFNSGGICAAKVRNHLQSQQTILRVARSIRRLFITRYALNVAGALTLFGFSQPATAKTVYGDCSITVGGKDYLDIKRTCRIEMDADGSFRVNLESTEPSYFAYVSMLGGGYADVAWNGVEKSRKASELLGKDFRRKGGCWLSKTAKVCALKR